MKPTCRTAWNFSINIRGHFLIFEQTKMDATFHSSSSIHSPLAFKNVKCFGMHMYNWLSVASSLSVWLAYLLFGWGSWSKCIKRDFHLITPHHHRPKEREKEEKVTFMWPTTKYDEAVPFLMVHTYCFGFILKIP